MDPHLRRLTLAKKTHEPRKIPVDKSILSDVDRAEISKQAAASIADEMAQDARDAYFAEQLAKLRRKHIPAERKVEVLIDLAPYAPHLLIDNDQYFHGFTYTVDASRAAVMYEQMQRSWGHQDEIDGRSRLAAYQRPQNRVLGPGHANTPTRGANGIVTLET
jgi:hypothetical protein